MQAKVYLNQPLTQDRYGLHFEKGEAHTDNEYLIKKLQSKGVKVEIEKEIIEKEETKLITKEKTIDEMSVAELKKYAEEKNIEIPSNVRSKADIVKFIKNYKEPDKKEEIGELEGDGKENPETPEDPESQKTDTPDEETPEELSGQETKTIQE